MSQICLSDEDVKRLMSECSGFEYVRFTMSDINGIPKLKSVPARNLEKYLKRGTLIWEGTTMVGPSSIIYDAIPVTTGNIFMRPQVGTGHPLPWATNGKHKVGEVLCEAYYMDSGLPMPSNPRTAARKQISRLAQHGMSIITGCEMEFMLLDKKTKEPLADRPSFATANGHAEVEEFMYTVDKLLSQLNFNIETFQEEYSRGQLELVLGTAKNITGADQVFVFKQALREIASQNNMMVTFMTMPFVGVGNGLHFNHSLKTASGENPFYDPNMPDGLSEFALHWIAGLMKHAKAITALCCPTVNCYRRLHTPWSPDKLYWGLDDRFSCYRVKNDGPDGTYVENRLPSGSSNPYLIMAATIAAGLDGVENKLECPPAAPVEKVEDRLADTLEEALQQLKDDEAICKAFGDKFVEHFIVEKREAEIKAFGDQWSASDKSDTTMEKEREIYLEHM